MYLKVHQIYYQTPLKANFDDLWFDEENREVNKLKVETGDLFYFVG